MPPSTTSLFPDINVWVALTYEGHAHHANAAEWFAMLSRDATFVFCRFTQLGLLRLLTAEAVMSDEVMTQPQAWAAYDRWLKDPRVELVDDSLSGSHAPSPTGHQGLGRFLSCGIRRRRTAHARHVRLRTAGKGEGGHPAGISGSRRERFMLVVLLRNLPRIVYAAFSMVTWNPYCPK